MPGAGYSSWVRDARDVSTSAEFAPRCPTCRFAVAWEGNAHRPFCSERCQLADLGGWVTEQYRIPGATLEPEAMSDDDADEGGAA